MKLKKALTVVTSLALAVSINFTKPITINAASNPDGMPSKIGNANVKVDLITNTKCYATNAQTKTYIVIHDTAGRAKGLDAQVTRNYFQKGERAASAQYAVDDHEIVQIVSNTNRAYHCGDQGGNKVVTNSNSIGIELCVNTDGNWEKTLENGVALTKWLMQKYNIPADHVVRHYDVTGKPCPEMMLYDRPQDWPAFKKAIGGDAQTTETIINKTGTMNSSSQLLQAPGTGSGSVYSSTSKVSIPSGAKVDVLAEHINGHYLVSYNKLEGYVPKSKVTLGNSASSTKYSPNYYIDRNSTKGKKYANAQNTSTIATTTTSVSGQDAETNNDNSTSGGALPYNPSLKVSGSVTSLADDVKLFDSPSETGKEVGEAQAGTECTVSDKKGNWYKISANGVEGWVPADYVNNPNYNSKGN